MKKVLMMSAFALIGIMNAQTEKGSWVVGGTTTLGFSSQSSKTKYNGNSTDGPKQSTFVISPSVGYFVANKIAVGLDLALLSQTVKNESTGSYTISSKATQTTISVLPTATYFFKSDSKLIPYLGAGVGYASSKTKYTYSGYEGNESQEDTTDGFAWKAKGGVMYLITPSIGLDLGVSFSQVSGNTDYPNYVYNEWGMIEQVGTYKVKNIENTFGFVAGFSFFFK